MSRLVTFVIAAAAALAAYRFGGTSQAAKLPPAPQTLPGARAVIDATNFPTLQAALDAVPAEGGVVELPPGTFEITE
ncbi:MAG: hypothetical protein QM775_05115, partial [Pirellulales bacterium]